VGAERACDRERGVVGRQHVEHEARDAATRGVRLQLADQQVAEAVALELVGDRERDVGDGGVVSTDVAGGADDAALLEREQADVAVAVDVRQRGQRAARELGRHAGEEPLVARGGGEPREELGQTRPVVGRLGSQRDGTAVTERDGGAGEHAVQGAARRSRCQ